MMQRALILLLLAATLAPAAEKWTEYRSGPFRVLSDAGDKPAREALNTMEQLRFMLGTFLGSKDGLDTVWPVELVLFPNQKEYGAHVLSQPFVPGGSLTLSAWSADTPLPHDWLRGLAAILIEDNAGPIPDTIETAITDLFSTIQVTGTHVTLGTPPGAGELPAPRMRAWAKAQLLATNPDYTGKLRVYLNNLQQSGDEGAAVKNAFDISAAELDKSVDSYLKSGTFQAAQIPGRALSPSRDFIEKPSPEAAVAGIMAELKLGGKSFPEDSPRGLSAKGTPSALELAVKANPRWGEPHAKLAALENNPQAKIEQLKIAAKLNPRNVDYWQQLARAQESAELFDDAAKSWGQAEHAAPNEAERARIHLARMEESERRAEFDISERKRLAAERAADLERVKAQAAAEIHAAEDAANQRLGGLKSGEKPVAWWTQEQGEYITGTLTRVDCIGGSMRLTILQNSTSKGVAGPTVRLAIEDPQKLTVREGTAEFACGIQKPTRKIGVVHDGKANQKLGTTGSIKVVELP
jgi:hypothetical protein